MKPILLLGFAILLLTFASCRKHDCIQRNNSWTINGVKHDVSSAYYIIPGANVQMLFVRDGDSTTRNSNVDFDFNVLPSTSGDYTIGSTSAPNQMQILATSYFGNDQYGIYSSTSGIAHVRLENGRMTIDVPELWLRNTSSTDSVRFSAHVYR